MPPSDSFSPSSSNKAVVLSPKQKGLAIPQRLGLFEPRSSEGGEAPKLPFRRDSVSSIGLYFDVLLDEQRPCYSEGHARIRNYGIDCDDGAMDRFGVSGSISRVRMDSVSSMGSFEAASTTPILYQHIDLTLDKSSACSMAPQMPSRRQSIEFS